LLSELSAGLKACQVRVVAVEREQILENIYWLIKLVGDPVTFTTAIVTEHDQRFGHGAVVVRAHYTPITSAHSKDVSMSFSRTSTLSISTRLLESKNTQACLTFNGGSRMHYLDSEFDKDLIEASEEFEF
jgi:hypothetical protein